MSGNHRESEATVNKISMIIITVFVGAIAAAVMGGSDKQDKILETLYAVDKSNAEIKIELKEMRRDVEQIKDDKRRQDAVIQKVRDAHVQDIYKFTPNKEPTK